MNTASTMEREPLVSIIGTVLGKAPAPSARQPGKVKLTSGQVLQAFPEKLQQIVEGQSYDFGCSTSEFKGVIHNTIRSMRAAPAAQPSPQYSAPPRSQPQRQAPAEPQRSASVNQHVPPSQNSTPQNGNGFYRPTHPRDAERMFTTATLGHFIDRGIVTLDPGSIADAVNVLREVWQATFGQDDAAT